VTTAAMVNNWLAEYGGANANVAHLLCDRHPRESEAFTFVNSSREISGLTYGELADKSRQFATVLRERGVKRGQRVPVLMGKRPELVVTLMAIWRLGAVHVPLFTAFETGAIQIRVDSAEAEIVVTESVHRKKLEPIDGVDVLDIAEQPEVSNGNADSITDSISVGGDEPFIQLYTSGTTGKPKGVAVPVRALASFQSYFHYGLDVRADDVYWNAADPGWAYGLYYGVIAPLAAGHHNVLLDSAFTAESTIALMKSLGVTNFAGAPTMYRAMSKDRNQQIQLRRASSAGEPLPADITAWGRESLGVEVRDHYGQTELGMAICNSAHPSVTRPVKDSSMGQPIPGFAAGEVDGQIAIDVTNSPLMWFSGYQDTTSSATECFTDDGRWYLTGDSGYIDDDGYFFFTARNDDVIISSGYRIGPFDVESVLVTHPAVDDVAVVGSPDPDGIRGQIIEAHVVLSDGYIESDTLVSELQALVRESYSKHAYPRRIRFLDSLPRTPSGKAQRYLLRDT